MEESRYETVIKREEGKAEFFDRVDMKGRITIPRLVREELGLRRDSLVKISVEVLKER